jgi:serine/threonine-protein kinase
MATEDSGQKRFGRYEVLSELGRGAMGVVYKARDPKINRTVAIKTISLAGQSAEDEKEFRERFVREAEAAGRLSHPGIVTIFDVGEEAETRSPYIVMEYVGGESLDQALSRDRKLPIDKALQLALELAEALDCAHGQGVVHRDLKPSNILLTEEGHAKIADFGIAKLNLSNQTLPGRALGTPAYMSPEQLNGEPVDGRSDIFSLGVILYTVVTGHRPFQGNSALTVSFKVVNRDPIPATLLDTELPEGLDAIIERAMAKDPANRYQRGSEMELDIRRLDIVRAPAKPNPPLFPASSSAEPSEVKRVNPSLGKPWVAANLMTAVKVLPLGKDASASTLANIRKRSVIGVVVLALLFILGLWVISFGSQGMRLKASEPAGIPEIVAKNTTPPPPPSTQLSAPKPAKKVGSSLSRSSSSLSSSSLPSSNLPSSNLPSSNLSSGQSAARGARDLTKSNSPRTTPAPTKVASVVPAPAPTVISRPAVVEPPPATLDIEVDHKFASARLSIWVDGALTYTHGLEGTDRKRLVVFHHVEGHSIHAMPITPGKHILRVQVTSEAATYDQSTSLTGQFVSAQEQILKITVNKHGDLNAALK